MSQLYNDIIKHDLIIYKNNSKFSDQNANVRTSENKF